MRVSDETMYDDKSLDKSLEFETPFIEEYGELDNMSNSITRILMRHTLLLSETNTFEAECS